MRASRKSLALTINLPGSVDNLTFQPEKEVYWPIFEAVKNALDAIEECSESNGQVVVEIERDEDQLTIDGEPLPRDSKRVKNITITDNGIGFDPANLESFNDVHSRKKKKWGGKGVGRLYWLKTFDEVRVESIFSTGSGKKERIEFRFTLPDGISDISEQEAEDSDRKTTIKLIGYKLKFEAYFRKKHLSTLKNDLIRHFMSYLMFHQSVKILLKDGDEIESISKDDLPARVQASFELQGKTFQVNHMKLKSVDPPGHHLFYCAHDRVVGSPQDLDPRIGVPSRGTKIQAADGSLFYYAGYVVSTVLDESVNTERNRFSLIDHAGGSGSIGFDSIAITFSQIKQCCNDLANEFLASEIKVLKESKDARIRDVFTNELPGLSYLQDLNADQLAKIPVDATPEDIVREVAVIHLRNRSSTEKEAEDLIERIDTQDESIESIQKQCAEKLEKLGRVYAADLAQYITGRASVLHLFSRLLEKGETGKYEYEKTLHSLVFPMRKDDSKSKNAVSIFNHNLWLFDEKFAYYEYIASDLQLKGHKPLAGATTSQKEPDISIYFFSDDYASAVFDSIVIVEFKRPGRTDLGSGKEEDPVSQVFGYIDDIRDRMVDYKGREVPTRDNTKFFCYVVCDTETKYIRSTIVANYNMNDSLDPGGYFGQFPKRNAYVELISYRKLLADAYKRNLAFFRKLHLPENLLKQSTFSE